MMILWASQYAFIVAKCGHIGVTTGGHIGDFSGITKKGKKLLSFNYYPVNRFRLISVLLRWSLQYGRRWLQFPNIIDAIRPGRGWVEEIRPGYKIAIPPDFF